MPKQTNTLKNEINRTKIRAFLFSLDLIQFPPVKLPHDQLLIMLAIVFLRAHHELVKSFYVRCNVLSVNGTAPSESAYLCVCGDI